MKKKLVIIAVFLILFSIGIIVFNDDFKYILNSILYSNKICFPDSSKNKVAVIIAKDGIYDNEKISMQISKYFDSVKNDLNIDNAGIKKFPGKSADELDEFVDSLYLNDDVGYIILLGDDLIKSSGSHKVISWTQLPRFNDDEVIDMETNITYPTTNPDDTGFCLVNESGEVMKLLTSLDACGPPAEYKSIDIDVNKLSCINGDCLVRTGTCTGESCQVGTTGGYYRCRDVGVSYIIPPFLYSDSEKIEFVSNILETYSDYHNNFDNVISKYEKSALAISMADSVTGTSTSKMYPLPVVILSYLDGEKISAELKNKHILLFLGVHGAPQELMFGIGIPDKHSLSLDEYSDFAKKYGTPALFVDGHQCRSFVEGYQEVRHCCWPQIFLESGVWAYYAISSGVGTTKRIPDEKTMGLAIRKSSAPQIFVYGDILAHMR